LSIKKIVQSFQEELDEKDRVREEVLSNSRTVIRLSKQAVMATHRGELAEAERILGQALKSIDQIRGSSSKHQEFFYHGAVTAAFQEYAEAQTFYKLVKEGEFLNPKDFGIPTIPYLLGLADIVGELRRRALDRLRIGDLDGAEKCLQTMEGIYSELVSLGSVYHVASNLRRKCDVARRLIEETRGDVTLEARRDILKRSLENLEKRMAEKSKSPSSPEK